MERYNSGSRNRGFNRTQNGSNLTPTNMPANVPYGNEENEIDLNEWSNYTREGISMSGTSRTVSDFVSGVRNTGLVPLESLPNNARSSLQTQNLWHAPAPSFSQSTYFHRASRTMSDFVSGVTNTGLIPSESLPNNVRSTLQTQNLWHAPTTSFSQSTHFHGASRTVSDFVSGVTNTGLIPSESLPNNVRSTLQTQNLWHAPTTSFSQSTHFHGASRTVSDFVSGVTNTGLIPSESLPNNVRSTLQTQNLWHAPTTSFSQSTNFHGASRTVSDFVSGVTNTCLIPLESLPNNARRSLLTQNLWHAPTTSFSHSTHFHGASRTVSDFVSGVTNSDIIPSESPPSNARRSLQTQNLWHAPTTSFSQSTHFQGDSNSTYLTFSEQHTDFHGGSSSASRNQSNAFIQPSVTQMMMSDLPESSLRYQYNVAIQPSSGPVGYLPGRDANFLRNDIDPPRLPLLIGESTVAVDNRETIQSMGGSVRDPGNRDDPILIEDGEEDEHGDAQDDIFYDGDMSYEALLALQENIGDVGTGLKKKFISEHLKKIKYQAIKMKNCSDSCCICRYDYEDGEVLGIIDCGHEFHYECIRKWLKVKNSCPYCNRIALTP